MHDEPIYIYRSPRAEREYTTTMWMGIAGVTAVAALIGAMIKLLAARNLPTLRPRNFPCRDGPTRVGAASLGCDCRPPQPSRF